MSWGNYMEHVYEKRYWEREAPLRGEMMGLREGDHSSFVQETYRHNHWYTHHPIGLIHELRENPAFRHLTLEQLVEAVYARGCYRRGEQYGYDAVQIDPYATRHSVALTVGLSCRACDNLIFKGQKPTVSWNFIENTFRKLLSSQFDIAHEVHGYRCKLEYLLPVFCEDCYAFTKHASRVFGQDYRTTRTLNKLLAIIEGQLGILDTRKRRKRRV